MFYKMVGIFCSSFTLVMITLIFCFNHKTKKIFSNYYFYLVVSSIFLIYFIVFRWIGDLKSLLTNDDENLIGGIEVIKSKVLLLDMCPFNAVVISLLLIFDKKRNLASMVSYLGIIGGAITIFGQTSYEGIGLSNPSWIITISNNMRWWEYIFFNDIYFILHLYLTLISIIVLLNSKSFNLNKIILTHVYCVIFFVYISIMSFSLNINWNVTGIKPNDWSLYGQYSVIGQIIDLPWPWQPIIVFTIVWLIVLLLIQIRNTMILDKRLYLSNTFLIFPKLKRSFEDFALIFKQKTKF